MCGRYYVDDETAREMVRLVEQLNDKLKTEQSESHYVNTIPAQKYHIGDIHPTDLAPVIMTDKNRICCKQLKWGYPGFGKNQVLFNARSETAFDKVTFQEGIKRNRAVIPAAWFYEWNREKEKSTFYRKDQSVLYMAGCVGRSGQQEYFVILTTAANTSMEPVHDRMPLILEKDEVDKWLICGSKTREYLRKQPCELARRAEFTQLRLF